MTDNLTAEQRRKTMTSVRDRDTAPEMVVRRLSHALGYRHRLHRRDLPGKPDLVYPRKRKVIFVHGCFWHGHEGCKAAARPASNTGYWDQKLDRNMERDRRNERKLREAGWSSLVIWECETFDADALRDRLLAFLQDDDES